MKQREEKQRSTCTKRGSVRAARTSSDLRDLIYRCESAILRALDKGEDRPDRPRGPAVPRSRDKATRALARTCMRLWNWTAQ